MLRSKTSHVNACRRSNMLPKKSFQWQGAVVLYTHLSSARNGGTSSAHYLYVIYLVRVLAGRRVRPCCNYSYDQEMRKAIRCSYYHSFDGKCTPSTFVESSNTLKVHTSLPSEGHIMGGSICLNERSVVAPSAAKCLTAVGDAQSASGVAQMAVRLQVGFPQLHIRLVFDHGLQSITHGRTKPG